MCCSRNRASFATTLGEHPLGGILSSCTNQYRKSSSFKTNSDGLLGWRA